MELKDDALLEALVCLSGSRLLILEPKMLVCIVNELSLVMRPWSVEQLREVLIVQSPGLTFTDTVPAEGYPLNIDKDDISLQVGAAIALYKECL